MTCRGRICNGVVVFSEPPPWADGTSVVVKPVTSSGESPVQGSPEAILGGVQAWAGEPDELERLLAEVQQARDTDLSDHAE